MKTKLNIWLIALLMTVGKTATASESASAPSPALVNVVLVQVDTSPEAVAAKRFETGNWTFWDQAAPRLLARLEGDFGRTRATGHAGPEASLYGVRCAVASLDDTQSLKPLAEHLDGISKLTGRSGLLLVWMPNQGSVLLGEFGPEGGQADYSLATLARIPPTHAQQTLGLSIPAVAPPCVIVSASVRETAPAKRTSLDLALRDGGLDSLSHSVVLSELRTAASESASRSEPDLVPGAEIRVETLQKNVDRFNDITKTLYKVANLEMPTEMKVPLAFAAPVMGDLRSAGEGKFHPLTSQSLERVGKFGMSELPKVIAALEAQGKLPSGYLGKLTPFLAGAPDIVAGAASQAGRGTAVPTIAEVTRYLDGLNKACWAVVGGTLAAPGGASSYTSAHK